MSLSYRNASIVVASLVAAACSAAPSGPERSEETTSETTQALAATATVTSTRQAPTGGTLPAGEEGPVAPLQLRAPPPGSTPATGATLQSGGLPAALSARFVAGGGSAPSGGAVQAAEVGNPSTSCSLHNVYNVSGGPVVANPVLHFVFWGTWSSGQDTDYISEWKTLGNSAAFWTRLSEYQVGQGSYEEAIHYTAGRAATNIPESGSSSIQSGLLSAIQGERPGSNDIYVIFLPSGTTAAYDGPPNNFNGHHQRFNNNGTQIRYAVIEAQGVCGPVTPTTCGIIVSHEISEAATNPDGNAYYDPNSNNKCGNELCEIGDPCQNSQNTRAMEGNNQIQQIWSQDACACVTERPLDTVNYPNFTVGEDETVFRPSQAEWYVEHQNTHNYIFGGSTDIPYAGDFNGDGIADWALFRDGSQGNVFVLNTITGIYSTTTFGTTGDVPVRGDFDGDGISDIAVWRPSSGTWYVIPSTNNGYNPVQWGGSGDIPISADWDGDGITDLAVFRGSTQSWYFRYSSNGHTAQLTWSATTGDIPVAGDYNGDGIADMAYWHPATGTWFIQYTGSSSAFSQQWGGNGDIPVLGDFDADWQTDMAVWRPSTGHWFVIKSSSYTGTDLGTWGVSGDLPVDRSVLR